MESFSKSKLVLHRLISWYPLNRKTKEISKGSHTQRKQLLMDENTTLHLVMSAFCWHGDEESKKETCLEMEEVVGVLTECTGTGHRSGKTSV